MTLLPIVERELRAGARGRAVYWTRFAVVLVGMLVCLPRLISPVMFGSSAAVGRDLLNAVVSAAFLVSCAACLLTADLISSERRQGTLGLLLLTRVRLLDVLVGKLVSAGLVSLCALAALLPILIMPVLAGGATGGEVFRKGLALLGTLFLALAAGLWASARGREWGQTGRKALIVVAVAVLAPFVTGTFLGRRSAVGGEMNLLSPLGTLSAAGDVAYKAAGVAYWVSLLLVQGVAWSLLFGAVFRLRRGWQEERAETTACALPTPGEGEAEAAPTARRPLDDQMHPLAWLLQRQHGVRAIIWLAALAGLSHLWAIPIVGRFAGSTSVYWSMASPIMLAMGIVEGALFAWAASRFFVEARRTGELELLLTTPMGATQMVSTQWKVLKRALRWPLVLMVVPVLVQAGYAVLKMPVPFGRPQSYQLEYVAVALFQGVNTIFGVWALCWLGMWFGFRARGPGRAVVWAVTLAKGLPYLINILTWLFYVALVRALFGRISMSFLILPWLLQAMELLLYLGLIQFARQRLLNVPGGAGLVKFGLRESISSAMREAASAWRKARHWTPS